MKEHAEDLEFYYLCPKILLSLSQIKICFTFLLESYNKMVGGRCENGYGGA